MDVSQTVSLLWLLGLILAALLYAVSLIWRSDYGLWESILYLPTYLFGRLLWRVHFTNTPPPEIKAGAVLVANHRSSVDPFLDGRKGVLPSLYFRPNPTTGSGHSNQP
jgi:1-acyl-sn-glycerol-3-phosphate acyltransferase